jgi:hypothetical protein
VTIDVGNIAAARLRNEARHDAAHHALGDDVVVVDHDPRLVRLEEAGARGHEVLVELADRGAALRTPVAAVAPEVVLRILRQRRHQLVDVARGLGPRMVDHGLQHLAVPRVGGALQLFYSWRAAGPGDGQFQTPTTSTTISAAVEVQTQP